jgi:hypothetical protein
MWNLLETDPRSRRQRPTVHKPKDAAEVVILHPGEPEFERLRVRVCERFAEGGPPGWRLPGGRVVLENISNRLSARGVARTLLAEFSTMRPGTCVE